jgi:hypothetical protein
MAKKLPGVTTEVGILTYVELIEWMGMEAPKSPRERHVLNVMAWWDKDTQPDRSNLVIDLSQGIARLSERMDGNMFTIAKNAKIWLMRLGHVMHISDVISLFGVPENIDFGQQSLRGAMALLGNSMHVADIGCALGLAIFLKLGVLGRPE